LLLRLHGALLGLLGTLLRVERAGAFDELGVLLGALGHAARGQPVVEALALRARFGLRALLRWSCAWSSAVARLGRTALAAHLLAQPLGRGWFMKVVERGSAASTLGRSPTMVPPRPIRKLANTSATSHRPRRNHFSDRRRALLIMTVLSGIA
jgi:hypothetical protein